MNVEQRLMEAFQTSTRVEPTPDLFSRVVHSIEEDRRHRQRIVRTVAIVAASFSAVVVAGALSMHDGRFGRFVHRPTMELLEVIVLTTLLFVFGPAIRRFGRGYAADLWPRDSTLPGGLLRLLDVAYYLVGAGYVLLSTKFEFADGVRADRLAEQLDGAAMRIGGLILVLGLLHAVTFIVLPLIALVDNSTRTRRRVPRWVWLVLLLVATNVLPIAQVAVGIALFS